MRNFIHLSSFDILPSAGSDLLEEKNLDEFISVLISKEGEKIRLENGYSVEEMNRFINSLQDQSVIIFHGWIGQNNELLNLLQKSELGCYADRTGALKHTLSTPFKKFVSPFVADRLLSLSFSNDKERAMAFSYLPLLDKDHRITVESQLFKSINADLERLAIVVKTANSEQTLVDTVKPICSSDNISAINQLSKASYANKLLFVDTALAVIRSQQCTPRLANWLIKQLEELTLNQEHEYKITSLKKDLRTGKIKVKSAKSYSFRISWKGVLSSVLIFGVIVLAFLLIFNTDSEKELLDMPKHASSFREFTQEERIEIDSLLKDLRSKRLTHNFHPDSISPYSNDHYMAMRRSFPNPEMEELYLDYYKDGLIQEALPSQNCPDSVHVQFESPLGTRDLSKKNGDQISYLKNESSYDLIIIVGEKSNSGALYAGYIPVNGELEFKLSEGDALFTVAGLGLINYISPAGVDQIQLPSYNFKQHFCLTDYNYLESIACNFEVVSTNKEIKLLASGSYNDFYQIVDIKGALLKY
jgi:hypothetical protein